MGSHDPMIKGVMEFYKNAYNEGEQFEYNDVIDIRPHKQIHCFTSPARIQYLELIVSHAFGKFAESSFWKFVGV